LGITVDYFFIEAGRWNGQVSRNPLLLHDI
jgi:hypothetical protein